MGNAEPTGEMRSGSPLTHISLCTLLCSSPSGTQHSHGGVLQRRLNPSVKQSLCRTIL